MKVSEQSFRIILEQHPGLSAAGFAGPDLRNFAEERRRLEAGYAEFAASCEWLLDCTPLRHVSFVSPTSSVLLPMVEKDAGTPVTNGALIAAIMHMRIPHQPLPNSHDVRVGVSLRSPALAGLAPPPKPVRKRK